MDRFEDMAVFVAVVEEQGFAAGARRLHMSPPSVTRAVASLESRIGTLLLTRNTRSVRLTESGARYFADCRRILAEVEEAAETAAGVDAPPRGQLTVTASVLIGERYITPIIVAFLKQYPQVSVKALFVDRMVNMADESIDVAVRIAPVAESSVPVEIVGHVTRVVCAAPGLLQRQGLPLHPNDLQRYRLIHSSSVGDWRFLDGAKPLTLNLKSALTVNANQAAIKAACSGWGITRVMSYQIADQLVAGHLKIILSEYELPPVPIHIVSLDARKASTKVQRFVEFCAQQLRANPALN